MRISRVIGAAVFKVRHRHLFDDELHRGRLEQIADRFAGKRVALIGNASSIFETGNGTAIDSHDVVVRLKRGRVIDASRQGTRTEVLCVANRLPMAEANEMFGAPHIIWVSPKRELMDASMTGSVDCFPICEWRRLYELMGARRPSAGLISLFMLREMFAPAAITLFGFDWKTTKTFFHKDKRLSWHDWDGERELIAKWIAADTRLAHVK